MKLGFLVDLSLCMGCEGCEVACKVENKVPLHSWRLRVKYVDVGDIGLKQKEHLLHLDVITVKMHLVRGFVLLVLYTILKMVS